MFFLPIVHGGACVALGIPFRPGNTAATLYQCFLASGTSVPVGCSRFRLTKTTKVTSHSRRPAINTHNYTTIKSLFLSDFHHSGSACGWLCGVYGHDGWTHSTAKRHSTASIPTERRLGMLVKRGTLISRLHNVWGRPVDCNCPPRPIGKKNT